MGERYAVTEVQLNANGAIGHASYDYGENKASALSHYHSALASAPVSQLISMTVVLCVFLPNGDGYTVSETIKGTGTYTPPVEEGSEEE